MSTPEPEPVQQDDDDDDGKKKKKGIILVVLGVVAFAIAAFLSQ